MLCVVPASFFAAEWLVPMVTGELPPPASEFSFTKISSDQAALFGGCVGGDVSSELRLATVNLDSVVGERTDTLPSILRTCSLETHESIRTRE